MVVVHFQWEPVTEVSDALSAVPQPEQHIEDEQEFNFIRIRRATLRWQPAADQVAVGRKVGKESDPFHPHMEEKLIIEVSRSCELFVYREIEKEMERRKPQKLNIS